MTALKDGPPNERTTSPEASATPFPPHDPLPSLDTERAPATLDELRDLLFKVLDEPNQALAAAFESIGGLVERIEKIELARVAQAEYQDRRLDEVVRAARSAADGALEAVAAVNKLRDTLAQQTAHDTARAAAAMGLSVNDLEDRHERAQAK